MLWLLLCTGLGLLSTAALASPHALPPPQGEVDRLAVDLAGRLGPALEGRRIPGISLLVQVRQPPGIFSTGHQRLVEVIEPLVRSRLGALGFRRLSALPPQLPESPALARGVRERFELTLLVELVEVQGHLHLRGRLFDTDVTLWGRLKGARSRMLTHLHVSAPLSGELRSYLHPMAPASALQCAGAWTDLGTVPFWAAALGDVDGDGRSELVLLGGNTLWVQRWSTVYGRFDTLQRMALAGPQARVRPRFPLASLVLTDLDGDRRLDILARTSERDSATTVSFRGGRFVEGRRLDGYPVGVTQVAGKSRVALAVPLVGRAEWNGRAVTLWPPARWRPSLPPVIHGMRVLPGPMVAGKASDLVATVDREARLRVARVSDGGLLHQADQVGAVLALGDLTGNGQPEVVTTTAQQFGTGDALSIHAMGRRAPLCMVKGFEGSVTALAVGDIRTDGTPRVVAVVWNERLGRSHLLVVR